MRRFICITLLCLACASCVQKVVGHRGYKFTNEETVYNGQMRDAVIKTMGPPTMISGFNPNVWYYIDIETISLPEQMPKTLTTIVLEVEFDSYYDVVKRFDKRVETCNLAHVKFVPAKDFDTYHLQSLLEKAASSLQPTPIR